MKKIIFIIICIMMCCLSVQLFADGMLSIVNPLSHSEAVGYWDVEGGKIEIKDFVWQFGLKSESKNRATGKIENYYTCFFKFTIVNNSKNSQAIAPTPMLSNGQGFELQRDDAFSAKHTINVITGSWNEYEPIFTILNPGESHEFEGSFEVSKIVALETKSMKIGLTIKKSE